MTRRIAILSNVGDDDPRLAGFDNEVGQIANALRHHNPDWQFTGYEAHAGELPDDPDAVDGLVFSGSPASVNQSDNWISGALDFIRAAHEIRMPMVGICFGHQAIAKALGGTVSANPQGWVLGPVPVTWHNHSPWMQPPQSATTLYALHTEQVSKLPSDAVAISSSEGCPIAGFRIRDHVMTTQHHPEMQANFLATLLDLLQDENIPSLDPALLTRARAALKTKVHSQMVLGWIANFLSGVHRQAE